MLPVSNVLVGAALWAAATVTATDAPGNAGGADAALAREASPEVILQLALERSPELKEQRARTTVVRLRARQASRLPDPRFKYEQWGVPLRRPWDLGVSDTLMFGLSQTFPAYGSLDGQSRVVAEEERTAAASEAARRRDLRAQVRRAFADYYRAHREAELHREHVQLTTELVEIARAGYRSGRRAQQDILRLSLELARLHSDVAHREQEQISAVALLNALMGRPADAPLGSPTEPAVAETVQEKSAPRDGSPPPSPSSSSSHEGGGDRRPEIVSAQAALRRSEAAAEVARAEARWPSITIGADYWYMPLMPDPHGYGAMVSLSLPWLSPGRRDAVAVAEATAAAERYALDAARNTVQYEVRDARAKFDAARSTFAIVDRDVVPEARRNYEAARALYASGQGDAMALLDALRSYLDVRLDRVRALVHLETTSAELDRVLGRPEPEAAPVASSGGTKP